jgi:hypothetical protein
MGIIAVETLSKSFANRAAPVLEYLGELYRSASPVPLIRTVILH